MQVKLEPAGSESLCWDVNRGDPLRRALEHSLGVQIPELEIQVVKSESPEGERRSVDLVWGVMDVQEEMRGGRNVEMSECARKSQKSVHVE